jgi:hypothetical protein
MLRFYITLCLAIGFVQCSPHGGTSFSYDIADTTACYGDCSGEHSSGATITLSYPQFTEQGAVLDSLRAHVRAMTFATFSEGSGYPDAATLCNAWGDAYFAAREEIPDFGNGWFLERATSVLLSSHSLVTLRLDESVYSGGAHPNSTTVLLMCDGRNGSVVTPEQLIPASRQKKLLMLAEKAFRSIRAVPDGQSLLEAGYSFDEDRFRLPDNIALTDEGLLLYYNSYEVASYAQGPTEIVLPRKGIAELLHPNFRLDP